MQEALSILKIVNWFIKQFPSAWKTVIITPMFKSGDHVAISNCRPISIPPAVSKIAEKWISDQILSNILFKYI